MTPDQFLCMRWNNVPLAKITNTYKSKILAILPKRKIWYGYTAEQWRAAFKFKEDAEKQTRQDNIKAAHELIMRRRRKEFELQRATYRLLDGICKALEINNP
jgi:hypothetical protein